MVSHLPSDPFEIKSQWKNPDFSYQWKTSGFDQTNEKYVAELTEVGWTPVTLTEMSEYRFSTDDKTVCYHELVLMKCKSSIVYKKECEEIGEPIKILSENLAKYDRIPKYDIAVTRYLYSLFGSKTRLKGNHCRLLENTHEQSEQFHWVKVLGLIEVCVVGEDDMVAGLYPDKTKMIRLTLQGKIALSQAWDSGVVEHF